jgi:hypothetical protein
VVGRALEAVAAVGRTAEDAVSDGDSADATTTGGSVVTPPLRSIALSCGAGVAAIGGRCAPSPFERTSSPLRSVGTPAEAERVGRGLAGTVCSGVPTFSSLTTPLPPTGLAVGAVGLSRTTFRTGTDGRAGIGAGAGSGAGAGVGAGAGADAGIGAGT